MRITNKQSAIITGLLLLLGVLAVSTYLLWVSDRQDVAPTAATSAVDSTSSPGVGDVAPDFSVRTLDDKDLTLSSFRGKYVLLDFWASWCGPCRGETPNLKVVFDAHGQDQRFSMVSLSIDQEVDDARQYTAYNQMSWHQAYLPGVWNAPLLVRYGITGIPSIWLIGPDGKVIAKDLLTVE